MWNGGNTHVEGALDGLEPILANRELDGGKRGELGSELFPGEVLSF